jgi:cyanophycinase
MNLILYGSGEFTPAVRPIDEYIIETNKPNSVAILPTAAGSEPDVLKWIEMAKKHFAHFNLPVIPVPILNRHHADDQSMVSKISDADWIFFSGGSPDYLISNLSDTLLWSSILSKSQNGVLLAGSSAGAMVLGSRVLINPYEAMQGNMPAQWRQGLTQIDSVIIPHFDVLKGTSEVISRIFDDYSKPNESNWIGIDEDTALIINDHAERVIGRGGVEVHTSDGVHTLRSSYASVDSGIFVK